MDSGICVTCSLEREFPSEFEVVAGYEGGGGASDRSGDIGFCGCLSSARSDSDGMWLMGAVAIGLVSIGIGLRS